jgi:hypothetical protein
MFSTATSSFKRKLVSIAIFASLGCIAVPASATVIHVVENGILMGANNVDVNGTKYDVRFFDGILKDVFPIGSKFDLSFEEATFAASALINTVFIDTSFGPFDSAPSSTFGCVHGAVCVVSTPYDLTWGNSPLRGNWQMVGAFNWFFTSGQEVTPDRIGPDTEGYDVDFSNEIHRSVALWTPILNSPMPPIPEPSTYAMMGLGLIGLMGIARRRQNQA